jgi:hypothetical protein
MAVIVSVVAFVGCSSSASSKSGAGANSDTTTNVAPGGTLPSTTTAPSAIDACKLLTAPEASRLAGATVKLASKSANSALSGSLNCIYAAGTSAGAELSVKVDADAATAHAGYPDWVQPIPGVAAGLVRTELTNLGDEASETRTGNVNDAIYVRKGAVLVKIGVYPPAGDAALRAAALTALSRVA